jgi:hypothetical protein
MFWQKFEEEAQKYIKEKINLKDVEIKFEGGSDSNVGDIRIIKKNKHLFNIEIKKDCSQIGQFVILPDNKNKNFVLGNLKFNTKRISKIHTHMNNNFEYYKSPNSTGIILKCSKDLMYESIKLYCDDHNIKFFISKKESSSFKIISTQNFEKNFDVSGKYRKKKSGTSYLKDSEPLRNHLKKLFKDCLIFTDEKGLIIKLSEEESSKLKLKKNRSSIFSDINIYFSPKGNNEFYLKKKSGTNNPTLIFSIEFHNKNNDDDLLILKNMITSS